MFGGYFWPLKCLLSCWKGFLARFGSAILRIPWPFCHSCFTLQCICIPLFLQGIQGSRQGSSLFYCNNNPVRLSKAEREQLAQACTVSTHAEEGPWVWISQILLSLKCVSSENSFDGHIQGLQSVSHWFVWPWWGQKVLHVCKLNIGNVLLLKRKKVGTQTALFGGRRLCVLWRCTPPCKHTHTHTFTHTLFMLRSQILLNYLSFPKAHEERQFKSEGVRES